MEGRGWLRLPGSSEVVKPQQPHRVPAPECNFKTFFPRFTPCVHRAVHNRDSGASDNAETGQCSFSAWQETVYRYTNTTEGGRAGGFPVAPVGGLVRKHKIHPWFVSCSSVYKQPSPDIQESITEITGWVRMHYFSCCANGEVRIPFLKKHL